MATFEATYGNFSKRVNFDLVFLFSSLLLQIKMSTTA